MTKYLDFLREKQKIDEHHESILAVDLCAQCLLERIAIADEKQRPLTVSQAMMLRTIGSPATIQRKIDDLEMAGLIIKISKNNDYRVNFLFLTEASRDYFNKLEIIIKMMNSSNDSTSRAPDWSL